MPRNGSGVYSRATADYTTGTVISSTAVNTDLDDIESALTASLAKDGQTVPTANLPMGAFKHTGVADGTARTHYQSVAQAQDGGPTYAAAAGTDTYTCTFSPAITAWVTGMTFRVKYTNANTSTTPTLNPNAIGAKTLVTKAGGALSVGAIAAGGVYDHVYDGTNVQLGSPSVGGVSDATKLPLAGGTLTGDVTLDTNAQILLDDSITAPGAELPLAFNGDRNTGMLRTGADAAALAANGATVLAWNTSGVAVTGTISATVTAAGVGITATSTDAGAAAGPNLITMRNSASPAASDVIGAVMFRGKDSGGNDTDYAYIVASILDATNGSEDGDLNFHTAVAGADINIATMSGPRGVLAKNTMSAGLCFVYSAGVPAVARSVNVSSLTDNGTGDLTVNLTTAVGATDIIGTAGGYTTGASIESVYRNGNRTQTTTALQLQCFSFAGVATDIVLGQASWVDGA